jgi:hypothetical protein
MKLRSTRGEYWLAASDKATTVIEKTTPATVIIDVAIADSMPRAPSAPAPKSRGQRFDSDVEGRLQLDQSDRGEDGGAED